jgi:peptidyl-prolyl cis-trans isomerase C
MLRPEVQMQLDEAKNAILFSAVLEDYLKSAVTDKELRKQYDIIVKTETGKQYRARHILVKTPEEATAILAQLQQGKKFEDLAKDKSIDKGSAVNGGDLDWAKPEMFVPTFSQAMVALQKGETTKQAVKSEFGYHIIKLDDMRDGMPPSFDEVKQQLAEMIKSNQDWQKQKLDELQKELRSKAVIK